MLDSILKHVLAGFIKADIKYVAPKHNVLAKEIHSSKKQQPYFI